MGRLSLDPTQISRAILKRANEPATKVAMALYLLSGAYLVFHVAFLGHINPLTIALYIAWVTL